MRRLIVLSFSALALVGATATAAVSAPRPIVPNVICGGACDGGGGVSVGGWCPSPGAYNYTSSYPHYTVVCTSGHTWWYA